MRFCSIPLYFWISALLILISQNKTQGGRFKRCNENAFCKRYRKYVEFVGRNKKEGTTSIWSVNPKSLEFFKNCGDEGRQKKKSRLGQKETECTTLYFELQNTHHLEIAPLRCSLFVYRIGVFRLVVDDTDIALSNFKRFKVGKDVVFEDAWVSRYLLGWEEREKPRIKVEDGRVRVAFMKENVYKQQIEVGDECEYEFEMTLNPFKVDVFLCGERMLTVNGNQFFNFERSGRIHSAGVKGRSRNGGFPNRQTQAPSVNELIIKEKEESRKGGFFGGLFGFQSIRKISQFFSTCCRRINISDIVDAVDVYSRNLWVEEFQGFLDFKYDGPTSVGVDVLIHSSKDVYGLAEKTASLNLEAFDEPYRLYNVDNFKYRLNSTEPMYGSSPMLISLSDYQRGKRRRTLFSSVLWVNPSDTYVKIAKRRKRDVEDYVDTWWVSESGVLDIVALVSADLEELYYDLGIIMGFPNFAPRFSLGFHYSKWERTSEERVKSIQSVLGKYEIPYDSIWLDIEHTVNKQYFTWNKAAFPNVTGMINMLDLEDRHLVIISDPHFSVNNTYHVYSFFEKLKHCSSDYSRIALSYKRMFKYLFLVGGLVPEIRSRVNCHLQMIITSGNVGNYRYVSRSFDSPWVKIPPRGYNDHYVDDFVGNCWPGPSKYLNFFSPKVGYYYSRYFEKMHKNYKNIGYWVDMNEPSVFDLPEISFPKQVRFGSGGLDDRQVHSLYSFSQVKHVYDGLLRRRFRGLRLRPFILSRSFWLGSHRYSVVWTGDTESNWSYYDYTIITNVRNAICGFSLTGSDVGGYEGYIGRDLFIRWHQLGIWFPFYRQHNSMETLSRDGIFSSPIVKKYIELRYSLIPYWYTLLAKYAFYGTPMIRPLFWLNPRDLRLRSVDKSFLVGDSFLINSIETSRLLSYSLVVLYDYICDFGHKDKFQLGDGSDLYKIWYNNYQDIMYIDVASQYFGNYNMSETPDFVRGGNIIPYSSEKVTSSARQLRYPTRLVIYLTGRLLSTSILKSRVLFPNTRRYYYGYYMREFNGYNDFVVDALTLHSEGSIYLDDGETFSYLDDGGEDYVFDDIVFGLSSSCGVEGFDYTPNIIHNVVERNILKSAFDEVYQRERLKLFKEHFGYVIYLKKKRRGRRRSAGGYNTTISSVHIRGMMMRPRDVILERITRQEENCDNSDNGGSTSSDADSDNHHNYYYYDYDCPEVTSRRLKYKLIKSRYYAINNMVHGDLYSLEIILESEEERKGFVSFGDYNWRIKILL